MLTISRQRVPGFVLTMSKNVSQICVVQWVIIAALSPLLVSITGIWLNLAIGLLVLIASFRGGALLKKTNLIRV